MGDGAWWDKVAVTGRVPYVTITGFFFSFARGGLRVEWIRAFAHAAHGVYNSPSYRYAGTPVRLVK